MFADIRIGYIVVPEGLVETFELAQRHMGLLAVVTIQDGWPNSYWLGLTLPRPQDDRLYKGRRDRMLQALAWKLAVDLSLMLRLADATLGSMRASSNDHQLSALLLNAGVVARPCRACSFTNQKSRVVSRFAAWNEKEIDHAARILWPIVR